MDTGSSSETKSLWDYFPVVVSWGWVIFLSAWGGAVSYFHNMKQRDLRFSLFRFLVDVWTSAFVGVLTYLLCQSAGIADGVAAAMVGIAGHMGPRALLLIERKYEQLFQVGRVTPTDTDTSTDKE